MSRRSDRERERWLAQRDRTNWFVRAAADLKFGPAGTRWRPDWVSLWFWLIVAPVITVLAAHAIRNCLT
jgi:hypothetical protein